MALKLTKDEIKTRDEHCSSLREKWDAIVTAREALDKAIEAELEKVNAAIRDFEGAKADAESWRDEVSTRVTEEFDDRSTSWREGDRGGEVYEWIGTLDAIDFSEVEKIEAPNFETLDDMPAFIEEMEQLAEEA